MKHVVVIGGGAAGMMAAIAAADCGCKVTIFEKNEKLGKKLFITGKGRCNVTNAADMEDLFANVCRNEKFLYSAFYDYDNRAVMDLIEKAGCPLKVERGDRVFPVSDHSSDIIAAFSRALKERKVEIKLNTEVKSVITEELLKTDSGSDEAACIKEDKNVDTRISKKEKKAKKAKINSKVTGVQLKDGKIIEADSVIICTGGKSYQTTGSTGDGYRFAESKGHKVTELFPALVPFNSSEDWCAELMGLALKNVSLVLLCGDKEVYSGFGEMLFTHFGLSGPLVLSASSFYVHGQPAKVLIDLKPAMDEEQLDKRILRDFEENKNKQFKNSLGGLFPIKLIPVMIRLSGINPEKKVNEISREERQAFVKLIKNLPMQISGTRGFEEAIITRGGVSVKDVNPSTMESKLVQGLYFAGEVLDLDALTGGFNLQIAWSTGHLAGVSQ